MNIGLVVLGLFVLVWIISAVVKATQDTGSKRPPASRPRPPADAPRIEKTSNSDIDRFMAEIDRLRRKGEGAPAGPASEKPRPVQRPVVERTPRAEPRSKPAEPRRERDRERRARQTSRPVPPAPPPLPMTDALPVLRPVRPTVPTPPSTSASAPIKPARTATTIATTTVSRSTSASPVLETLRAVLRSNQGPAAAVILAEIFGEPRGRKAVKPKAPPV